MDSLSFEGFVLDPSKCSKLTMEEKREIVYEVSRWSQGGPELLQSWSRQEILQILCSEMGKERKYTGLTKLKIIEHLLRVVSEKRAAENSAAASLESSENGRQRGGKRRRKADPPSRPSLEAAVSLAAGGGGFDRGMAPENVKFCKNLACRAKLGHDGTFCRRCSCCICRQYDDNKDPSLWLICSPDPPFDGDSCGSSCHLECALRHSKSGIPKDGLSRGLDGSFSCVACGKLNDLLGCWRKQMTTARDTRRVDILCYRVSLSQKLLTGTVCYQTVHGIVNEAMAKLEDDVGPLSGLPVKRARGIVNRLSSGQEVQRLCALAVDSLDSVLSDPTFTRTPPNLDSTDPSREFGFQTSNGEKVESPATNSSSLSNPSSVEDENNNVVVAYKDANPSPEPGPEPEPKPEPGPNDVAHVDRGKDFDRRAPVENANLPITPCKAEASKDGNLARKTKPKAAHKNLERGCDPDQQPQDGSSSKKRSGADQGFGYYVKVVRWLECEGHIDTGFRQRFLTWYSLRATPQEVRIVKAFVDTMMEDPASLAGQLVDTFSEVINSKKCSVVSSGLCLKLFH